MLFTAKKAAIPPLALGVNLPSRVMMEDLSQFHAPQSARAASLKEDILAKVCIAFREPCTAYMMRLQRAISDVEAMGRVYSLDKKVRYLEKGLAQSGEKVLATLATSI